MNKPKMDFKSHYMAIKPAILTFFAVIGYLTLARFEFFGLVSESMSDDYKVALGLGVVVICLAGFKASRGNAGGLLLCFFIGIYVCLGSFSGRVGITETAEVQASNTAALKTMLENQARVLQGAADAAERASTIQKNHSIFNQLNNSIAEYRNLNEQPTPLTTHDRRKGVVEFLSWIGISATPYQIELIINALFILVLFWGSSYLARAGKNSGNVPKIGNIEGNQNVSGSQKIGNDSGTVKQSFSDVEIYRAVNVLIAENKLRSIKTKEVHEAIRKYFKCTNSIRNELAVEVAKAKNLELKGVEQHKQYSTWGNVVNLFTRKKA